MDTTEKRFAIGFSFPGVHRGRVKAIADILAKSFTRERILYDDYHEAEFSRPNLDTYLQELFTHETELLVIFICEAYNEQEWCGVEWRALRARLNRKDYDSIMFLKLDGGEPDGYFGNIDGCIDISYRSDEDVAGLILRRHRINKGEPVKKTTGDPYAELKEYLAEQLELTRKRHPSFQLMEIDDMLFPDGIPEPHYMEPTLFPDEFLKPYYMETKNDAGEKKPVGELVADSWRREKNHLMIEGEGGIGKTVTLLSLPDRFAPWKVPAVYVQLHELKGVKEDETLEDYIREKCFHGIDTLFREFLSLTNEPWKEGPQVLLLLDGFNEITPDRRFTVGMDILRWSGRKGIQIVTTSRFDIQSYVPLGEEYVRILLQPLSRETIKAYLNRMGIPYPEVERLRRLIDFPLMMTLFARTQKALDYIDKDEGLQDFKENNSAGAIIWNYLQREIWRYRKNESDVMKCVLAAEFIAPYVAWKMQQGNRFYLDERSFQEYVRQGCQVAASLEEKQFPKHLADILSEGNVALPGEKEMLRFLKVELRLFVRRDDSYSLIHWQFRDALAAMHLINVSYASAELPEEWKQSVDHTVMDFVAEISSQKEADRLWEQNRPLKQPVDTATVNLLELQKRKRDYDFSQLNFSGWDFRNISLFPYRIPGGIRLEFPRSTGLCASLSVSEKTFLPEGHSDNVTVLAITPDGRRCVSGSDDHTLRVWDLNSQQYLMTLGGHEDTVVALALAITTDMKRCVSASLDNTLRIWDLETGMCLRGLAGHDLPVTALAVTPDGHFGISGSWDNTLRVWDLDSGKCLRTLEGHTGAIECLAITPDGRRCVSGSEDHTLRVWDFSSGACLRTLEGHKGWIRCLAITPDGRRCVSGSEDHTLRIWELSSGACLHTLKEHEDDIPCLAITPDGRRCVSGSWDKTLRIWDLGNGHCMQIFKGHKDIIRSVAITPDGRECISSSWDKTLRIWSLESGKCLQSIPGDEPFGALAVSPDGRYCVSGSDDKALRIWDLESNSCLKAFEGHRESVSILSMTPDGRRCVSWSEDKALRVWDLEARRCLGIFEGQDSVRALAITPDGRRCVSLSEDKALRVKVLRVWALDYGRYIMTIGKNTDSVHRLAITPDGYRCVSGGRDKTLRIWDLRKGHCLQILEGHEQSVDVLAITPDSRRCVSGSKDKTLRVWNLETGKCLSVLNGHKGVIEAVAISPDGKMCASWSSDKTLRLWSLESSECLRTVEGLAETVSALAFTADGRKIACWTRDAHVHIWVSVSGNWQYDHYGPKKPIQSIALSPDGRRCVCGSVEGTIFVWRYDQEYDGGEVIPIRVLPLSLRGLNFTGAHVSKDFRAVLQQNGVIV